MKSTTALGLTAILLAFLLGAFLWGGRPDLSAAERERARIENQALERKLFIDVQQKSTLSGWIIAAKIAGGAIVLLTVAGITAVTLRWLDRRAAEIHPAPDGQYPLIRIRVGGATGIHDPNRQLAPTVLYTTPQLAANVAVLPISATDPERQERTTARAQLIQLTSAAHRYPSLPAPIPNTQYPIPNTQYPPDDATTEPPVYPWPSNVPLLSLLDGHNVSLHQLVLGITVNLHTGHNEIITGDLSRLVHVAVGGSSGWGKSVFLRTLAYQLALCPENPQLALVDLEGVTFAPFASSDRLLYPIADTEGTALALFQFLIAELDARKAAFNDYPGVDSLSAYNAQAGEPLSPLICLTDEATALLADKSVETALRTLALRGRKYGLWCILGGQDWKSTSLDTAIRNQLAARFQFRAMSPSQSRVLLQQAGAETLAVPGRALAILPGRDLLQIQTPLISPRAILAALSGQSGPPSPIPNPQSPISQDLTANQKTAILELAQRGDSLSAIAQEVFGYRNSRRLEQIRRVLEECDT